MINALLNAWDFCFRLPRWTASRSWFPKIHVGVPVVSVGNLSMGGTGKTPFICALIKELNAENKRVAVVCRNYRARLSEPVLVEPNGADAPDFFGDEPTLIARLFPSTDVYVAQKKWKAALLAAKKNPDVILVDDGFQHWRLARDLDLVLIDGSDPAAGHVFPFGRLREPWSSLAAADFVFQSKGESSVSELKVMRKTTFSVLPTPETQLGIFCAIGNPAHFFSEVDVVCDELLIGRPLFRKSFRDHHNYSLADVSTLMEWLSVGKRLLLTTEKDWVKCERFFPPSAPIALVHTEVEIPENREFREKLQALLH